MKSNSEKGSQTPSRTPRSTTSSTPKKKAAGSKDEKEEKSLQSQMLEQMAQLMGALQPVADFHKSVEDARDDDLRLFWDIRVLRGKNEPFMHTSGSSSLPKALSSNMIATAPSLIQSEIADKIAAPLVAQLQDIAEEKAREEDEESVPLMEFVPGEEDEDGEDVPDTDLDRAVDEAEKMEDESPEGNG